jgi:acetyl esterase/lipase
MPYGVLLTLAIWAVLVAFMLRPPRRPLPLARAVYYLSVAANELPMLVLLLLAVTVSASLLTSGAEDSGGPVSAALGAALGALLLVGLVLLQRRVGRTRAVIARTVGLPEEARPFRWAWLAPLPLRPREVERVAGLTYGPGGREHRLDLYRRRDRGAGTEPAPVLLYFHGGGYRTGSRRFESRHLRHRLAQRGWVVLSAAYGLRPGTTWPGHLIDAKQVIAWVHEHADEHGMDPARIVVAGSSAGGHLAVHCALTADDPVLQPGIEGVDTRIAAAVVLYGYLGRYYGQAPGETPVSHPLDLPVDSAPPILVLHGDTDNWVPVTQARDLVAHLRSGSPSAVAYAELPGAQHGFDVFASPRFRAVMDGIEHFLSPLEQHGTAGTSPRR